MKPLVSKRCAACIESFAPEDLTLAWKPFGRNRSKPVRMCRRCQRDTGAIEFIEPGAMVERLIDIDHSELGQVLAPGDKVRTARGAVEPLSAAWEPLDMSGVLRRTMAAVSGEVAQ